MKSFRSYFVLPILLATAAVAAAQDQPKKYTTVEGITEYRMSNGLRVLLVPDASRPLVTVNLTIFCGSRHEGYGETGMAHLLEHMVFKGTPTFPDVPKALRDHGAKFNGTTWVDRTNYYETMPSSDENLEFGIRLEADRMINSYIKREDLLSEMTVVRNEFERGENDPNNILSQRMMATAYEWHNYGKSTIGNRSDIERVPVDNLREFYKRFYQPDNAMLVIAGKYDEAKALGYVQKYFGAIKKPTRKLNNTYTEEPAQDGERLVTLRRVGTTGALGVIYHIPAGSHEEFPAVAIMEDCLTNAPSGRLYKALVETKKVSSLSGTAFPWHDPGVIEINAKVDKAEDIAPAKEVMLTTLENLIEKPITEEEVTRSKQRFANFNERLLASSDDFAIQLSEWASAGDWRLFFVYRDRIEKVTAAQVNEAAKKYLVRTNRTVGEYLPAKKAERAAIPTATEVAKIVEGYQGRKAVASGEVFDPTPENIEQRTVRGNLGGIKTVYLTKKTRGEVAEITLNLRFGNAQSLNGKNMAADMLGNMMSRGTRKRTRQEFNDELNKLSASARFSSQLGVLSVRVKAKRENIPAVLKLVGEALREPAFKKEEFDLLKLSSLESTKSQLTDPGRLAFTQLMKELMPYPKDDVRYIPTLAETVERIEATTLDQVVDLYEKQLSGMYGELAAVGDFDAKELEASLKPYLENWKTEVTFARIPREAKTVEKGKLITIETPDKENAFYFAGIGFAKKDSDEDYPAMVVGNYLFGAAPLASRLSNRVRGEEGLSYGIQSMYVADTIDERAFFQIFAITNPKNISKVNQAISEEINKVRKDGLSLEELNAGKKAYIDQMKVERSDDSSLSSKLASYLYTGRTFEHDAKLTNKINQLEIDQVNKALNEVVDPKKLIIINSGDFQKK
ncbi:MAG: pitrilysin family protein [Zavarzinella sp.]